jgi:hypothetical protein
MSFYNTEFKAYLKQQQHLVATIREQFTAMKFPELEEFVLDEWEKWGEATGWAAYRQAQSPPSDQ